MRVGELGDELGVEGVIDGFPEVVAASDYLFDVLDCWNSGALSAMSSNAKK